MKRPIGYYVHHHGDGHRQRAMAIAGSLSDVVLIGTGLKGRTQGLPSLDLPDDRLDDNFAGIDYAERPSSLHYAPLDHEGVRQRTALITNWIAQARPRLMVVDVSVEVAMLCRLASLPTVYVRLNGRRQDMAHLDAFRGATALLAPFHKALDDEDTPEWVRQKSFYAPGIVRSSCFASNQHHGVTLVVVGRGGGTADGERWADAARATPQRQWRVIGPVTVPATIPANLELSGWVDDADSQIAHAEVVIGGGGDGVVSTVLAARRPFICLPESRPFGEQHSKAKRLAALGGAIVCHDVPRDHEWPGLIAQAIELAEQWPTGLTPSGGPDAVAQWLAALSTGRPTERKRLA